jgi:RNA polymerase sigma factor (sigma-70 family)
VVRRTSGAPGCPGLADRDDGADPDAGGHLGRSFAGRLAMSPGLRPRISGVVLRSQSDARLALLAREGHQLAFTTVFERYQREFVVHAARIVRADRAEDVVQHAMLKAWSAMLSGEEVAEPRAWLHRIVHNAALDAVARRGYNDVAIPPDAAAPHLTTELAEGRMNAAEALAAVAALPQAQRRALTLTALEGRSVTDAAVALQISEPALRQLVYRARTRVRNAVGGVLPLPFIVALLEGSGASAVTAGGLTAKVATVLVVAGGGAGAVVIAEHEPSPVRPRVAHAAPTPSATPTVVRRRPPAVVPALQDTLTTVPRDEADPRERVRGVRPVRRRQDAGGVGRHEGAEPDDGPAETEESGGAEHDRDRQRGEDDHDEPAGEDDTESDDQPGSDDGGGGHNRGPESGTPVNAVTGTPESEGDSSGQEGELTENDDDSSGPGGESTESDDESSSGEGSSGSPEIEDPELSDLTESDD